MAVIKQIIALGGRGFGTTPDLYSDPLVFERYLLAQICKERPKICFIPTASAEAPSYIANFYQAFSRLDCLPTHLSLFRLPEQSLEDFILAQDIIFVGGGNTKSMLALWKAWKLDVYLRQAWQAGTLMAGSSAGAICWFEQGVTDSLSSGLSVLPALGFVKGSVCPHYDDEKQRKPAYQNFLAQGLIQPGFAVDHCAALHFIDDKIHKVVRLKENAQAYWVSSEKQEIITL